MAIGDGHITGLLADWHGGNREAFQKLVPLVYDALRSAAARHVWRERPGLSVRPTELVHELFLKLDGGRAIQCEDRGHFFAIAAKLMRQVLVGHARLRGARKRGGSQAPISLDDAPEIPLTEQDGEWLIDLDEALNALAGDDDRKAEIIEMRYFGGMTCPEIADRMGVSISTVERETRMALAWLRLRIGGDSPLEQPA